MKNEKLKKDARDLANDPKGYFNKAKSDLAPKVKADVEQELAEKAAQRNLGNKAVESAKEA